MTSTYVLALLQICNVAADEPTVCVQQLVLGVLMPWQLHEHS